MKIQRIVTALVLAIVLSLSTVSTTFAAGPINVTSGSANGSYNAGDSIPIQIVFDQTVIVDTTGGTPSLALNSGGTAIYSSGSGTNTLIFSYTVGSGENSTDLDYSSSSSLSTNGGTIRDGGGIDASLTLPNPGTTGSLGFNKNIIIDTTAPTVTSVTSNSANGYYKAGQSIYIQVTFSEIVAESGTPSLALNSGGTAYFTGGSPSTTLSFTYTVASGNTSADLDYANTSALVGTIRDGAGNDANLALPTPGGAGSLGGSKNIIIDTTAPTISIGMPSASITTHGPVTFLVTYADTNFNASTLSSSNISLNATGSATGTIGVSGSGLTRTVTISSISGDGTLGIYIAAGTASDLAGNSAPAAGPSTSFTVDNTPPSINIGAPSVSITKNGPVTFIVSYADTNFNSSTLASGNITLNKTGSATGTIGISGSGLTRTVTISSITGNGTLGISIAAGTASDTAGNLAPAAGPSTTFTVDNLSPSVTINQAGAQPDPTNASPIIFTVVFSEATTDFATGDITLSGTAGATTAIVTGSGTTYNVAVSGMTTNGTVIANIAAGRAHDAAGNANTAGTFTDNTVTYDSTNMTVTINKAGAQPDPTNASPIIFTVVFSKVTTDFLTGDVTLSGTAGATTAIVTGSGTTYNVAVSGMTANGTVIANIPAGVAHDSANNLNSASTSTDNTVIYDTNAPTVTINKAASQPDPTKATPINFTVVFSEPTTDFLTGDVTLSGTAGATTAIVTGSGTTYNVAVSGMTNNGTVIANIVAGVAHDAAGNANTAGTFTDNNVSYDTSAPVFSAVYPITGAYINSITTSSDVSYTLNKAIASGSITMTWVGGETDPDMVHNCILKGTALNSGVHNNLNLSNTNNGCTLAQSLVSGAVYTFTFNGTDSAGNPADTVTRTNVTFDNTAPTIIISAPSSPITKSGPVTYIVSYSDTFFSESTLSAVTLNRTGTADGIVNITGSGLEYSVSISSTSGDGTLGISIAAGTASDMSGNLAPAAGPSTIFTVDNTLPDLNWTAPVNDGGTYYVSNEIIPLTVAANDTVGISMVIFKRWDPVQALWIEIGRATSAPFSINFDTSVLVLNNNQINAYAYDVAGNSRYKYIWLYHLPVLTVIKASSGTGTVTSSPLGINCGTTCSYGFADSTVVTLTAVPTAPSIFWGWSGAGCSGRGTCTVTMNSSKTVTANFSIPHKLYLPVIRR